MQVDVQTSVWETAKVCGQNKEQEMNVKGESQLDESDYGLLFQVCWFYSGT